MRKTYSALTRMTALLLVLVCVLGLLPATALAANPSTIKMDDCMIMISMFRSQIYTFGIMIILIQ